MSHHLEPSRQSRATVYYNVERPFPPGAPLTYFNDGGGGPKDFFGSDILAKRDFLGSMKDAGIFLGRENNRGIFMGIVFFISSNQK